MQFYICPLIGFGQSYWPPQLYWPSAMPRDQYDHLNQYDRPQTCNRANIRKYQNLATDFEFWVFFTFIDNQPYNVEMTF